MSSTVPSSRLDLKRWIAPSVALVLGLLASEISASPLIPAPTGGTAPSILLSQDHGPPGAAITVSGVAPASPASSAVRVQWLPRSATQPIVEVGLDGSGGYAASLTVPEDAGTGPARVCAGLTDLAAAELACADFFVDEPAPGIVEGKLPGGFDRSEPPAGARAAGLAAVHAVFNPFAATQLTLVSATGKTVAATTPAPNGSFRFENVPPGQLTLVQGGAGPKPIAAAAVSVSPGLVKVVKAKAIGPAMFCGPERIPLNINNMEARPAAPAANAHFGTYLSGVPLPVEFSLKVSDLFRRLDLRLFPEPPAPEEEFDGIEYVFRNPQGVEVERLRGSGVSDFIVFDVGRLPPGISTVTPLPVVDGQVCLPVGSDGFKRTIRVVKSPIGSFARADSTIRWHGGFRNDGFYRFTVIAPDISALPLSFPRPPITQVPGTSIDLPIRIRNEFDANTALRAEVRLNGDTTVKALSAGFTIDILDQTVLDEEASISPPGNIRINFVEPRLSSFEVNIPSLLPIRQEFTIYEGTVLDLFGLVQVIGALTAGFQGDVGLFTTIQPFVPNLSVRVVPEVAGIGSISAGLGALNFVSGGARLNTRLGIAVPFQVRIDPFFADVQAPCGILQASAELFVRLSAGPITLLRISSPSYPIVLPAGIPLYFPPPFCSLSRAAAASASAPATPQIPLALDGALALDDTLDGEPSPLPAVNPKPAIAVSPSGERLLVYVEDASAGSDTITPRIVARLQNPATGEWGAILPITDGSHWVADPTVTWAGSGASERAIAAWTERPTTLAEDLAIDDDIAALLTRHEIYLATFQGGVWSAPERVTNDLLPDGAPSISGDATGSTLAWIFDADGDPRTRADTRIKIREAPLDGPASIGVMPSGVMSFAPSVVRRAGTNVIAFTTDLDPATPAAFYRFVEVARGSSGSYSFERITEGDSPSLAITNDGAEWIGFLVRGLDDDGVSEIGDLSTRARVYSAARAPGQFWEISSTSNADGGGSAADERGESPLVLARGDQALMVFRSFALNSPGFGQLMLARLPGPGDANPFRQLSFGAKQRWFPSAAIDPANGDLVVVSIDVPGEAPAPDDYALVTTLTPGLPDPAIASLEFRPPHAPPGEIVEVEATIQNLGLVATGPNRLTVDFFDGPPESGNLLASEPISTSLGLLNFGAAFAEITAAGGPQTIWVRVRTTGENADPSNDVLSGDLRKLAAPQLVQVHPVAGLGDALDVSWLGPIESPDEIEPGDAEPAPQIGYRIERSDLPGGPRELAGESTTAAFRDALLVSGGTYCYAVTAYDATGLLSIPSEEVCAELPAQPIGGGRALAGASLRLSGDPANPSTRRVSASSRDPGVGSGLVANTSTDPVRHGATLRLGSSSGDSFEGVYELPASGWSYLRKRGVVQGYKYVSRRGEPAGPVKSLVLLLGRSLRLQAKGELLAVSLNADPSPVNLELSVGPRSQCLQLGGRTRHVPGRSFSARNAPPPSACPILPPREG